jgi:superfamily II DNA or RNA helicase
VEGIIVDEAHTLGGRTFQKVALACDNAWYRIGLSGTPFARTDDRAVLVQGALGPVIYKLEAAKLVSHGILAKPTIWMVPCYQARQDHHRNNWKALYDEQIVESLDRNRLLVSETLRAPKPALLFVRALRHGYKLKDLLEDMGVRVHLVTGRDPDELRQRKIAALESGRADVVVATVVLQEGVDIPELRSVIVASGGKSGIAAIQRVGRAMRVADGKSECVVIDIFDQGDYTLQRHAKARRTAYRKEGYDVQVACPGELSETATLGDSNAD